MGLISFEKPPKLRSSKEHGRMHFSDCGIDGTYVPNMSDEDRARWKGRITGTRKGRPQVEIRKDSFVTIVGLQGYDYKHYKVGAAGSDTSGLNIHIASAGPVQMTFEQWDEWRQVVEEARQILEDLP
jgi:hypothetical protein